MAAAPKIAGRSVLPVGLVAAAGLYGFQAAFSPGVGCPRVLSCGDGELVARGVFADPNGIAGWRGQHSEGASSLLAPSMVGTLIVGGLLLGARGRGRRAARGLRARAGSRVVMRDGSSWGSTPTEASTSVDTSGPLPIVKLSFGGTDEAIVNLFGGCVTSYKTSGTEWIAVRPDAKLDGSKPISGGLPHCFPQFGPGPIQQHGFARNMMWRLLEEPSENGVCVLELKENEETLKMWPFAFRAEYRIELLTDRLKTTLTISNPDRVKEPMEFFFTTALHSYFAVGNIGACEIRGDLFGAEKIDKTEDPPKVSKATKDTIKISKFTEEIYKGALPGSVVLKDPSKGELEIISGGGWKDVVVWNPYGDENMGADKFVCVESAALDSVSLPPGGAWDATLELVPKPDPTLSQ